MKLAREGRGVRFSLRAAMVVALVALAAGVASAAPAEPSESVSAGVAASAQPAASSPPQTPRRVPWPPPLLTELSARDPARAGIDRAWRLPAKSLAERVSRTQRAGMVLGLRELDGPARALLLANQPGNALERAEYAVDLAPGLPAAHASLARAKLQTGDVPGGLKAIARALDAVPRHLDARAWMAATLNQTATWAALGWAVLFLLLGAVAALPTLLYGLGATRLELSGPASLAVIGTLIMGLALIEGPAGAALGLAVVAVASGSAMKRAGSLLVTGAALVALHSGFERTASGRLLLTADPVGVAAYRIEAGLPTPADVGVALRAAASDPTAAHAVALHAKRSGDREAAAQVLARILATRPEAAVFNNAANVEYARGNVPRAIALYEKATKLEPSALVYFNLSQAYGRAIRLDDQDRALASAQVLDAGAVERLAVRTGAEGALVADATLSAAAVAARVERTDAPAKLASAMRARLAPGWLGRNIESASLLALLALGVALAAGNALERAAGPRDFYADLARTLRAGVGDSTLRVAQLNRLRKQRAHTDRLLTVVALVVPGAAGLRFGRPLAALIASAAFAAVLATVAALLFARPDPMAVGPLPGLLAQLVCLGCALVYVLSTAAAFALRAEE